MSVDERDLLDLLQARLPPMTVLHFSCKKESKDRFKCIATVFDERNHKTYCTVKCYAATLLKAKTDCATQLTPLLSSFAESLLEGRRGKKVDESTFDYWSARNGEQELRRLEQFFSLLLFDHFDIFEIVNIYTRLRNDHYESLAQLVGEKAFGEHILWFLQMLIDNTTDFAKTAAIHYMVLSSDVLDRAIRLRDRVLLLLSASPKRTKLTPVGKLFTDDDDGEQR